MDVEGFDAIARALSGHRARRRALATLAAAMGLIGLAGYDDALADHGKCPTFCDECSPCKKGKCKKINGRLHCAKGKCIPKPDASPCAGGICYGGSCVAPFP